MSADRFVESMYHEFEQRRRPVEGSISLDPSASSWSHVARSCQRNAESRPAFLRRRRVAAPVDLTGYWVAVVTEDWRWRMVTPLKGDAASIPGTPRPGQ